MKSGAAMDAGKRTPFSTSYHYRRLLLILLCSSLLPIQGSSHGGEETKMNEAEEQQRQVPLPIERATVSPSPGLQAGGRRPRPGQSKDYGGRDSSTGAAVKEAASKSFKKSNEAVEHEAETAAEVAETAAEVAEKSVHETKEKVMKRTASTPGGKPDAEL